MVYKMYTSGCSQHFTGVEWSWNIFDFIIVLLACLDLITTALTRLTGEQMDVSLNGFTIIRLARLLRIARVVRLLRLQFFKELTLMVNGVIGGLRTLFWAIILLAVLVYCLGVLMRQIMMDNHIACEMPREIAIVTELGVEPADAFANYAGNSTDLRTCTLEEAHLIQYKSVLFGSVMRSMFTIFRCFTGDCSSPNGTPMIIPLWETIGPLLVIGYVFTFLFVTFGVFNLIMAIFVENTLEYARHNEEKRTALVHKQHVRVARQLQQLVLRVCGTDRPSSDLGMASIFSSGTPSEYLGHHEGLRGHMHQFKKLFASSHENLDLTHPYPAHMRVSRGVFEEALRDKQVQQLLDELDISISSRDKLFDILDSDGNDYIAISELVEGFMRLRGPADKGDIVSSALILRSLQKSMKKFEVSVLHRQDELKSRLQNLETKLKPLFPVKMQM